MGKHSKRNSQNTTRKTLEVSRESIYALISIAISLLVGSFYLGGYFMEAKKDREMVQWKAETEVRHREEIANKEKERDEWKEKCFQLMMEKADGKERSP